MALAKKKSKWLLKLIKFVFKSIFCIILILLLVPLFLAVSIAIKLTSEGPVLYWSDRVGRNNKIFKMPKFRSMLVDTPDVATHLLDKPENYLSPIGGFLRRSSLDELPQLFSVLRGNMAFVGPRPALYNQYDLIQYRTKKGIDKLLPGITGWAQVNGRDELSIYDKVTYDEEYLHRRSLIFDLKILWITLSKVKGFDGVSH